MQIKELSQKSADELKRILAESREKLRDMRFKAAQRQLKKIRDIRETKKIIARILTLLNQHKKENNSNNLKKGGVELVEDNKK